jgi:hypothetical protein
MAFSFRGPKDRFSLFSKEADTQPYTLTWLQVSCPSWPVLALPKASLRLAGWPKESWQGQPLVLVWVTAPSLVSSLAPLQVVVAGLQLV